MSEVKLIKLTSGEEILATVGEHPTADDSICVTNTLAVMVTMPQSPQDKMGFQFLPWGALVKGAIQINNRSIVYIETPNDEVVKRHSEIFRTISIAPKSLLIPTP